MPSSFSLPTRLIDTGHEAGGRSHQAQGTTRFNPQCIRVKSALRLLKGLRTRIELTLQQSNSGFGLLCAQTLFTCFSTTPRPRVRRGKRTAKWLGGKKPQLGR
ncbi:hypothetical protein PoB_003218400 [Plakobranchus ocellatus]|uniref:Uncharacterized protein n=1 Tax=Plakobranchus ocellatus TaxID=259542 RepID=A0AAV4AGX1_9GAST|nr:hypothetical protein PoB_003218400 [Plakobranchus ocellatus]